MNIITIITIITSEFFRAFRVFRVSEINHKSNIINHISYLILSILNILHILVNAHLVQSEVGYIIRQYMYDTTLATYFHTKLRRSAACGFTLKIGFRI